MVQVMGDHNMNEIKRIATITIYSYEFKKAILELIKNKGYYFEEYESEGLVKVYKSESVK